MRRSSCPNILEGLRGLYSSRAAITKINQGVETTQENWDMILWQRLDLFREPLDQTRDPRRQDLSRQPASIPSLQGLRAVVLLPRIQRSPEMLADHGKRMVDKMMAN